MDFKLITMYPKKQNQRVIRWLELVKDLGIPFSDCVRYAIACYLRGQPCKLGKVDISKTKSSLPKKSTLRISERDKLVYEFIIELERRKERVNSFVIGLVEESLDVTTGTEEVIPFNPVRYHELNPSSPIADYQTGYNAICDNKSIIAVTNRQPAAEEQIRTENRAEVESKVQKKNTSHNVQSDPTKTLQKDLPGLNNLMGMVKKPIRK